MASEKLFENKVKAYLDQIGAWHIKYWAGSQFTKSGVPDILACINGHFVAIEVKAQNGKPSKLQLYTIYQICKSGGFARFKEFIENLKRDIFNREIEVILK